ncbi:MAG: serine/threonine protein kinase, partial [Planctomycetes bacterium]|nr:serine/threonine protein kinase [Planctomycetota bacterium]
MSNDKKPGQLGPEEAELQTSSQVTANHIPDSTSVPPATQNLPETATGAWQSPDETGVHSNANAAEVEATRALPQSAGSQTRTSPAARTTTGAFVAVAGYEVEGELGRGGMGVVYKARQTSLNRVVALKMLLGAGEGTAVARFLAEAEAVAAIRHPHVVQVFDFGQSPDGPYMALEYLPGGTLADRLKGGQRLESRIAAEMFEKVARGLQAAHSQGIIHRDIKPGNVLFDESNEPKVADFGLAKRADSDLTRTGAVMGTPAYMAPEQADGHTREVGPTADVWAVGVMLYEALTGQRPFVAARTDELLVKVLMSDPDPLRSRTGSVPRDLDTICLKCLEKEPTRRYQSALALAQDLERFRAGEPI